MISPPTATEVGRLRLGREGTLTASSALKVFALFVNDSWALGRLTVNAGLRYDRYSGSLPEQEQLPFSLGPVTLAAETFPQKDLYTWNQVAPRIGATFDLTGDGRTVLKANYGLFCHNPGVGVGSDSNANTPNKSATYTWNDTNGDRIWQSGEEGARTAQALAGSIGLDPGIEAPVTHEITTWLERQLTDTMGIRAGYVYKTEDNLIGVGVPGRDARNGAYSAPFTFPDIGADNVRNTADDQVLTLYGMPTSQAGQFPLDQVVQNLPRQSRYDTIEVSMNRRYAGKWSASVGGAYTWLDDFPAAGTGFANAWPRNPNLPGQLNRVTWNLKATGSYDAGWGIRHLSGPSSPVGQQLRA